MDDLNLNQWWEIFSRTGRANPRAYANDVQRRMGEDYENDIIYDIINSSPGLQYARQRLPNNLGETGAGQWLQQQLPDKYRNLVDQVPLGGMTQAERKAYSDARAASPELRANTIEVGRVPLGNAERPVGDSVRASSAQAAGAIAGDLATDGVRNIWWFLNAPQAITQIAMLSALHKAGADYKDDPGVPLIKNRNLRMAATLPAVLGMSMAIGNAWRQPGYKAVVPSEVDPTQTADPLAEFGSRYILGRSGSLLPYDEFVKERPDVSKREYDQYKEYLFGNALPLKATLDGIQGPEVTFMGKSIPILTGVLPAVAAVVGGRYGVRKAAANLAGVEMATGRRIGENKLEKAADLREQVRADKADYGEYDKLQRSNEMKVLRNALLYSGGSMAGTALAGQTLESLRRALKGNVPVEQEQQPVLAPQPTSMV